MTTVLMRTACGDASVWRGSPPGPARVRVRDLPRRSHSQTEARSPASVPIAHPGLSTEPPDYSAGTIAAIRLLPLMAVQRSPPKESERQISDTLPTPGLLRRQSHADLPVEYGDRAVEDDPMPTYVDQFDRL